MPWLTRKGTVEASTRGGADASLLSQQLDRRLASAESMWTATRVCLAAIPSADEALCNLRTVVFVALHLFSAGGRHSSAVADPFRLITRLEGLHTEVQGMISYPHLATTLLFDVSRQWSLYLNRRPYVLASESLDDLGRQVPFSLDPIINTR